MNSLAGGFSLTILKKKFAVAFTLFLACLLLLNVPFVSAAEAYSTEFDDLTGWTTYADYKAELSAASYVSSPTSFWVSADGADQNNYGYRTISGLTTYFSFEFFVRAWSTSSNYVYVGFASTEPMYVRFVYLNPTSFRIAHFDGSSNRVVNSTASFTQGAWYNVTTEVDLVADTMKTYVNGSLTINESVVLSDTPPTTFRVDTWVPFGASIPATMYVDDLTIETFDNQSPTFSNHTYSGTGGGTLVTFGVNVSDDEDLSHYIFSTDNTGSYVNGTPTAFSTNPQLIDTSVILNDTTGNTVHWLWYANDTSGNWNVSATQSLTVTFNPYSFEEVDIAALWQYWYDLDFIGFFYALFAFTFNIESVGIGLVCMIGFVALYLRTGSLLLLCVAWLLVGTFLITLIPAVAALAILFLALGITGLIYRLFKNRGGQP